MQLLDSLRNALPTWTLAPTAPITSKFAVEAKHPETPIDSKKPKNLRKLLVFVNPQSGSGNAKKQFDSVVAPLWRSKDIDFEVVETKHAGHCKEYVAALTNFGDIDLVGVGGDGIIAEIVEGLALNKQTYIGKNYVDFKQVAIGHLPAGSGNGLAMSLLRLADRKYDLVEAAEMIAKGETCMMDLLEVDVGEKKQWAFLAFGIGLIPDIDISSERYRKVLGSYLYYGRFRKLNLWILQKEAT